MEDLQARQSGRLQRRAGQEKVCNGHGGHELRHIRKKPFMDVYYMSRRRKVQGNFQKNCGNQVSISSAVNPESVPQAR
jgi:hypothetical protein